MDSMRAPLVHDDEPAKTTGPEAAEKPRRDQAAERWVAAVNADGTFDHWRYAVAKKVSEVPELFDDAAAQSKAI
jgi:hypothetical protein